MRWYWKFVDTTLPQTDEYIAVLGGFMTFDEMIEDMKANVEEHGPWPEGCHAIITYEQEGK